jgi:hypothetical protein
MSEGRKKRRKERKKERRREGSKERMKRKKEGSKEWRKRAKGRRRRKDNAPVVHGPRERIFRYQAMHFIFYLLGLDHHGMRLKLRVRDSFLRIGQSHDILLLVVSHSSGDEIF